MKKTQRKDAIRNIFRKKVSWISIMIVTMLTVGVFLGCRFYVNSMGGDGKKFYKDHNFKDIEVISYTGILPSELDEFRKVEGVVDVEGYDQLDVTASINQSNSLLPLIRLTENVSVPELLTGRLPAEKGEIAISLAMAVRNNIKIGDRVHLRSEGDQEKLLAVHDFFVTGVVTHPEYLQASKSDFLLAADASFDRDELNGGYLRAVITVDYPDSLDLYSQKYYDTIKVVEDRIRDLLPDMIVTHREELRTIAEKKIMDETSGPRQKLADAEEKLADGKKQLEEGEEKLTNAAREIEDGEQKLIDSEKELESGKQKLDSGKKELEDGQKKYDEGKAEYEAKSSEAKKKLNDAKAKLDASEKEADAGLSKLDKAENLLKQLEVGPDLSGIYYSVKNQAVENYRPAMEAAVNQQDNSKLIEEAENSTNALVDQKLSALEVDDLLLKTSYQNILLFATLIYPDTKALTFLKSNYIVNADAPEVQHMITYLEANDPDISIADFAVKVGEIEELKEDATSKVVSVSGSIKALIHTYFNGYGKALAAKEAISGARALLKEKEAEAETELAEGKKKLDAAAAKLESGKKEYEDGLKKYEDGLKQYEEGKQKLEDAKKEYADGLATFEEKKKTYENGLKEYEDGKKKLDDEIAEARAKVDEKLDSFFVVQNRRANSGFVTIYSDVNTIGTASGAFIILFLLVCAMVAFSTIAIIVDEQRVLAGSMKSLGFFNKAIRAKYLIYGVSAAIFGCILGFPAGCFVENFFRYGIGKLFVYGIPSFSVTVLPFIISSVLVVGVIILSVYISTHGMLKLSAIQLMSGFKKEKAIKSKGKRNSKGIYGRLIRRNMRTELPRVIITTVIVAISCGIIGVGFNLKIAFDGIVNQQVDRVWGYDLKVNFSSSISEDKLADLEKVITDAGASYGKLAEIGTIYRTGDLQEYTYILVMDQDMVSDYYHIRDWETGEEMQLPDDGVLIMNRLHETKDLNAGDKYTLFDEKLREHTVTVRGVYENFAGRNVIMSREGYYDLFGIHAKDNVLLVHLNGADKEDLIKKLKVVDENVTTSSKENLQTEFSDLKGAFNYVVLLLTGVAIMMSIFILANLTNIFVSRRRKELIIMRVNGFSVKQCIRFLTREAIITSILGFIIAIILGASISRFLVGVIEQPDVMLYRNFQPLSWLIAIVLEAIFAFFTDYFAFRKVKNVKVTDVNA